MKKAIAKIIFILVLTTIGGMGYLIYNTLTEAEKLRARIAKLPKLEVISLIRNHANPTEAQPVIVNYFSSKCQFCQAEIQSIQQHEQLLSDAKVIFVSNESKRRLQVFSKSLGLDTTMVELAWDSAGLVKQLFEVKQVPVTFVYRADSSLINSFKGEIKAELLYESIK